MKQAPIRRYLCPAPFANDAMLEAADAGVKTDRHHY
jgi:hypothetical protein